MRPLWLIVVTSGGAARAMLVAACTAVTSGLLLVAVSMARVGTLPDPGRERLFGPVADPSTRGGAVFAVLLMVVPFLLLLDQAVRLGSAARERRYASLVVAGATRANLRRWGALEVGVPSAVGAVAGFGVHRFLQWTLGGEHMGMLGSIVPTQAGPGWWGVGTVVLVGLYGVLVGRRIGTRAAASWQTRREVRPAPRPWGALLVVAGGALLGVTFDVSDDVVRQVMTVVGLAVVAAGLAVLAPWGAYRVASFALPRVARPSTLLAVRRLMADARPAARAGAATGALSLAGATLVVLTVDLGMPAGGQWDVDRVGSFVAVAVCVVLAALLVAGSLAVRTAETLLDRRREIAALVASGVPEEVVQQSVRTEATLATVPMAVLGVLLGAVGPVLVLGEIGRLGLVVVLLGATAVLGLVLGSARVAAAAVRPWVRTAVDPANLRTE